MNHGRPHHPCNRYFDVNKIPIQDRAVKFGIQWNPSCEATPSAPEKWPFKRDGL